MLDDGQPFLVRDRRPVPHFFVEASQASLAAAAGAAPLAEAGRVTLAGEPLRRVEVTLPADVPPLRERLERRGVRCHEADIRFALRPLIDLGIRGSVEIEGPSRAEPGTGLVFDEPTLRQADHAPRLRVLSLDIETDPGAERLLSVAMVGCGVSEAIVVARDDTPLPAGAVAVPGERRALDVLARRIREIDPDVLTGWNVVEFDLRVLLRLAERRGARLPLGRGPGTVRLQMDRGSRGAARAHVPGRLVLDGIQLLRGAFVRMDEYTLDHVARTVLGEGKTLHGRGRADEILRLYREDRARFVEYNLTDARLALQILERLHLVELAVERSRLTGLPPDRVSASIAAFDFLYVGELARRGVAAPSVAREQTLAEGTAGGHVLSSRPGLHRNVLVLDFRSLYPSLIRTFQIDPWNLVREGTPGEDDPIVAPNGARFRRRKGILTGILDELMPRREAALAAGERVKSHAIKILMNSFYGVLGAPACRFHDPRLANAITGFGREVLLWTAAQVEAWGHPVLYGDTDSVFLLSGAPDGPAARAAGVALAARLNEALAAWIAGRWGVESRLSLQLDRVFLRLHLPSVRHGTAGARKRYAGLLDEPGGPRVAFTGLESVRGDWTELAHAVQRGLYERLFADRPLDAWLRDVVAEVRAGRRDAELVYRKGLRKPADDYTATTPPHVAAARKLGRTARGRIAYVMTTAGPEPEDRRTAPLDYEHYVDKQVRPVAEPVLAELGLDFAKAIGDDRQLSLF